MKTTIMTGFGTFEFELKSDSVRDLLDTAFTYAEQDFNNCTEENPEEEEELEAEVQEETVAPASMVPQHRRVYSLFPEHYQQAEENRNAFLNEPGQWYGGFLLIKCQSCGKVKPFCPKNKIRAHKCDCGAMTPLHDLIPAFASCLCGKRFKYMTNLTEPEFTMRCMDCGKPMHLTLNREGTAYNIAY